jgi:AcrR family transcriptional regulator
LDALIDAATRVFLQEGYGLASIDKIANEAGISTRTIYERFKNKGDLMAAVINRLCERDMTEMFDHPDLDRLEPGAALTLIGDTVVSRFQDSDFAALFRIVATEAQRFPELATKVRCNHKARFDAALTAYLSGQVERGVFSLEDPERAASLFMQMILGEVKECLLFEPKDSLRKLDMHAHVASVVQLFLFGAMRRPQSATSALRQS